MRVKVIGDGETAKTLRGYLSGFSHAVVVEQAPDFTVKVRAEAGEATVDGVDGVLEQHVVNQLAEMLGSVTVKRASGTRRDDTSIVVGVPVGKEALAARALFRALAGGVARVSEEKAAEVVPPEPAPKRPWWRVW